jgi:hypothetical protein
LCDVWVKTKYPSSSFAMAWASCCSCIWFQRFSSPMILVSSPCALEMFCGESDQQKHEEKA